MHEKILYSPFSLFTPQLHKNLRPYIFNLKLIVSVVFMMHPSFMMYYSARSTAAAPLQPLFETSGHIFVTCTLL